MRFTWVYIAGPAVGLDFLDSTQLKCDQIDGEHSYHERDFDEDHTRPFNPKIEKIVGGKEVWSITNWPFIGSLGGYCGGSIIGTILKLSVFLVVSIRDFF